MVVTRHTTYTCMDEVENAVLAEKISIGDCISVPFDGKTILFDVIGIDVDDLVEVGHRHSITIQTHDTLEARPFDETGPCGSNVWETSGIRQYLNGGIFKNRCNALTPYLATVKKLNSDGGITEDTFFLLSKEEYDPDVTPYPYYRNRRNRCKFGLLDGYANGNCTRSADSDSTDLVWYVGPSGNSDWTFRANLESEYAPACVLIF